MRRDYSKFKALVCVFVLLLTVVLPGCGKGDSRAASGNVEGDISRAEYIGMLGEAFGYDMYVSDTELFTDVSSTNTYYPEIQAAAEWQIIDSGEKFEPDKAATLSFVLESAVRAIGTDDIAASGADIDLSNLADFYVNNIAQIDLSNADAAVSADTAKQIIQYAKDYDHKLVLPQITEMEFMEGVKTASSGIYLNADGTTGEFFDNSGYSVGDIVYLEPTDTSLARAIQITGIDGNHFTFEEAAPEDVYAHLHIEGTFQGTVVEAVSASDGTNVRLGQEIYDEMKAYQMSSQGGYEVMPLANSVKVDKGADHVVFTASFDVQASGDILKNSKNGAGTAEASANGQIVVGIKNIRADVKYDHEWYSLLNPTMVECSLYFDTEVSTEIHGSVGASIPLGSMDVQISGPLYVKVSLMAHLGADGNISISYTTENVATVGWRKGTGLNKSFDSNPTAKLEADATLTAEATALADLRVGYKKVSYSLANCQVTSGAVAAAKLEVDMLGEQPACADVQLYVPLRWGVNQEPCLITDISSKLKYESTIWDSTSSPVKLHMHWENWQRTEGDKCTRGEIVEQPLTTPEGEPLEEINPFEFEPLKFDFIELVNYTMYLKEGASMSIGFANIPEGYTQADLKYEVQDSSVCSVSGGTVQGNKPGSTIVKISTKDGVFTVSLAVTVNEDYAIEGFQAL